jgi:hypothetical protein
MWLEATKTLGSACGDNVCGGPGPTGREYTFTYRVTRMNDYRPVLAPPGLIAIEPCGAQELQYLMPYSRGTGIATAVNVVAGGSAPKRAFGRTWRPWFGTTDHVTKDTAVVVPCVAQATELRRNPDDPRVEGRGVRLHSEE